MKLLLSLVCLLFGMSICACAHLGIEEDGDDDYSDDYEVITMQGEADGGDMDNDGDDDDDDDDQENEDAMGTNFALTSNNLATSLTVHRVVTFSSGDTVSIQVMNSLKLHIGLVSGKGGADLCAGPYFDPEDYAKCGGEVFQIYRAAGPGQVKVGEDVGFYYPLKRHWLAAVHSQTHLASCPGVPQNSHHRVNTGCWGEVFKIYARGKSEGQPIDQLDHVMIYYPRGKAFLEYPHTTARKDGLVRSTCPGQCLPPYSSSYERCFQYVFAIHKKM